MKKRQDVSILFLHPSDYFIPVQRVHLMAEALAELGYNVSVICCDKKLDSFQDINNVKIYNIYKLNKNLSKYGLFISNYRHLVNLTKNFEFDAIQIFSPLMIPLAIKLKFKRKCKIIYDCYEYWVGSGITSKNYHLAIIYGLCHLMGLLFIDGTIFVYKNNPTKKIFDKINMIFARDNVNSIVFYNVHKSLNNFPNFTNKIIHLIDNKKSNDKTIGYLGIVMKYKGYEEAIKSLNYLDNSYKLYLIGDALDGQYREKLISLINSYNLNSRIFFTGFLPYNDALEYCSTCDVGLILFEDTLWTKYSTPNKLFEYMALGIPIVANDLPNLKYFIDKTNSGVVTKLNSKEIAQNIEKICEDRKLMEEISNSGKKCFKNNYSFEVQIKKLYHLYSNIMT